MLVARNSCASFFILCLAECIIACTQNASYFIVGNSDEKKDDGKKDENESSNFSGKLNTLYSLRDAIQDT